MRPHSSTMCSAALLLGQLLSCGGPIQEAAPASSPSENTAIHHSSESEVDETDQVNTDFVEEWVALPFRIPFNAGEAKIESAAEVVLAELHEFLDGRSDIVRVRVTGHAEEGVTEAQALPLSRERAEAVVDHLVSRYGMPRRMFEVQAQGAARGIGTVTPVDRVPIEVVEFSVLIHRSVERQDQQ